MMRMVTNFVSDGNDARKFVTETDSYGENIEDREDDGIVII